MPTALSDDGDASDARLRKPRRARRAGRVRVRRSKGWMEEDTEDVCARVWASMTMTTVMI